MPIVTTTPAIIPPVDTNVPVSGANLVSEIKPVTAVTDTVAISKPAQITAIIPVSPQQKQVPSHAPSTPYNSNRLGSSTPAYDTWEKNSNGAGSVTTSPK